MTHARPLNNSHTKSPTLIGLQKCYCPNQIAQTTVKSRGGQQTNLLLQPLHQTTHIPHAGNHVDAAGGTLALGQQSADATNRRRTPQHNCPIMHCCPVSQFSSYTVPLLVVRTCAKSILIETRVNGKPQTNTTA